MPFIPRADTKRKPDLLDVYAFTDTLMLLWYRAPPKDLLIKLSRQYGRRLLFRPLLRCRRPTPWLMKLQQPTTTTLEALSDIQHQPTKLPTFVVHRVDIAVDFLCRTSTEAELATEFLQHRSQQNYRLRKHRSQQVQTTAYAKNDPKARRNICIYGDRRSKVTGDWCVHFEMRFRGSRACKAVGLNSILSLIEGFDVMTMLEHQSKLTVIDRDKLDRAVEALVWNTMHCRAQVTHDATNADRAYTPCISVATTANTHPNVLSKTRNLICRALQFDEFIPLN